MFNSYKWILGQLKVLLAGRHRQYFSTMAILKKICLQVYFCTLQSCMLEGQAVSSSSKATCIQETGYLI